MNPYILIAEDEDAIAIMLRYNLEKADFEVDVARDGDEALLMVEERLPDVLILDWMLPFITGVDLCRKIRADSTTSELPVIMLTARGEESDKLIGLDCGADDYVVKPFSPKELIARINAILRRAKSFSTNEIIEYTGITIDISSHKVTYKDKLLSLGPTEFRLLLFLMQNTGHIFSRSHLLDKVWGQDVFVEMRTVDVHIRRVRKTLNSAEEGLGGIIKTVRSAGYMLE